MKAIDTKSKVAILLATYNGERFLRTQLDSIINQTYPDWCLYICDDGSTDNTNSIINEYSLKESRIFRIEPHNKKKGAKYTFMYLLENVKAEYYMFSDQDDKWDEDKIEVSLEKIQEIESKSPGSPIVVHTDLEVVDENLKTIYPSFWHSSKINPKILTNFNYIGICNCATGCTMIFNNDAKSRSLPMPDDAEMHDWWITLMTAKNGIIEYVNKPTIKYRQHNANVVGARNVNLGYFVRKITDYKNTLKGHIIQYDFLQLAQWGGWLKFYYYKLSYAIQRNIMKI